VFERKREKNFTLMDDYRNADIEGNQATVQREIDDEFANGQILTNDEALGKASR
jgi:hypothetical protein